jgi:hypothetical protein
MACARHAIRGRRRDPSGLKFDGLDRLPLAIGVPGGLAETALRSSCRGEQHQRTDSPQSRRLH